MKKNLILSILISLVLPVAAQADLKTPAKPVKSAVSAKADAVKKLEVSGEVKWTGFGVGKSHTGNIKVSKGVLEMKGDQIVGGDFEMDMKSLTSDSEKLTGHLKSADFFEVEKFDKATFKITKVEALPKPAAGAPTHKFIGDLTIKGNTHPQEFSAVVTKDGEKYRAVADTEVKDRTKYNIVYNSKQFQTLSKLGDKAIEDNFKVNLNVVTK